MYTEPTWIQLLINSTLLYLGLAVTGIIITLLLCLIIIRIREKLEDCEFSLDDKVRTSLPVIIVMGIILIIGGAGIAAPLIWNEWMEKPSVREDTITITGIQPMPGKVDITSEGYSIKNSNQLMFITSDGREFSNTENWMFNKFETRSIFNKLHINGTYKIKYYGWRNGQNNEFPNILSIEEVVNENGTSPNDFNKYFGAHRGQRIYDVSMDEETI